MKNDSLKIEEERGRGKDGLPRLCSSIHSRDKGLHIQILEAERMVCYANAGQDTCAIRFVRPGRRWSGTVVLFVAGIKVSVFKSRRQKKLVCYG